MLPQRKLYLGVILALGVLCFNEASQHGPDPSSIVEESFQEDTVDPFSMLNERATEANDGPTEGLVETLSQDSAAPAPAAAAAVVKPLISISSKIRAKMAYARAKADAVKHVAWAEETAETKMALGIDHRAIATAKAKYKAKIAKAHVKAKKYVKEQIKKEAVWKKERHVKKIATLKKIQKTFIKIKEKRTKVNLAVAAKMKTLHAKLKKELDVLLGGYKMAQNKLNLGNKNSFDAWKAKENSQKTAEHAHKAAFFKKMDAIKALNGVEAKQKKEISMKEVKAKAARENKFEEKMTKKDVDEKRHKIWYKTHNPAYDDVKRLKRRAIRSIKYMRRQDNRGMRRQVGKSVRQLAIGTRTINRNIRNVARQAYGDLREMQKYKEKKEHKKPQRDSARRRYQGLLEKQAERVASKFGAAKSAADAAVSGVLSSRFDE